MKPIRLSDDRGEFFKIVHESPHSQVGTMTIDPGKDSGPEETHPGDQVMYVLEGEADIEIGKETHHLSEGLCIVIPARTRHHVKNTGTKAFFTLNVFAPPAY